MDWKEAIAKLKKLDAEGAADLVSVVEARIGELEADKFAVIGEKRSASSKVASLETALIAVAKAIGLEGDTEAILSGVEGKVRELSSSLSTTQARLTEEQSARVSAEAKVSAANHQVKLRDIATATGAKVAAIDRLFGSDLDKISVDADTAKFGDKPLKEHMEADEILKEFLPVVFPVVETPAPQASTEVAETAVAGRNATAKLPPTPPQTKTPDRDPLLAGYGDRYNAAAAMIAANK